MVEKQLGKTKGERFAVQMRVMVTDPATELIRLGTKFDFEGNPVFELRRRQLQQQAQQELRGEGGAQVRGGEGVGWGGL